MLFYPMYDVLAHLDFDDLETCNNICIRIKEVAIDSLRINCEKMYRWG